MDRSSLWLLIVGVPSTRLPMARSDSPGSRRDISPRGRLVVDRACRPRVGLAGVPSPVCDVRKHRPAAVPGWGGVDLFLAFIVLALRAFGASHRSQSRSRAIGRVKLKSLLSPRDGPEPPFGADGSSGRAQSACRRERGLPALGGCLRDRGAARSRTRPSDMAVPVAGAPRTALGGRSRGAGAGRSRTRITGVAAVAQASGVSRLAQGAVSSQTRRVPSAR
jgi:hypothetical protein